MSASVGTRDLLVELFVEELPPKALKRLGEAFATGLADGLTKRGLASAGSVAKVRVFRSEVFQDRNWVSIAHLGLGETPNCR